MWKRPPGPLNVWKVVEGYENLDDGTKIPVKFSIQDVPDTEERRKEFLDNLTTHFLAGEPLSKSLRIKEDPEGAGNFKTVWELGLDQGVGIGCYKLNSNGEIGDLVGCNSIFIMTEGLGKLMGHMKATFSPKFMKIWGVFDALVEQADVTKIFNVTTYISSISLSVSPEYRGQKLGYHILTARDEMAKKYGIVATSSMFTAKPSQSEAARAGFKEYASVNCGDLLDSSGNHVFPNVESKYTKLMMKKFNLA
ncbi:hypothetical protein QAD02_023305 [Eretmocerus hayati]|uniref:Uncharacterized protein n=1 Tax=Eretmocerus hayati TaxID=131215 RepID=A0ACC2PX38_9HYME|nr:hypothetical protein QAD02_023305 [Eretmocerus hayati]